MKKIKVASVSALMNYLIDRYETETDPTAKIEWFSVFSAITQMFYEDKLTD